MCSSRAAPRASVTAGSGSRTSRPRISAPTEPPTGVTSKVTMAAIIDQTPVMAPVGIVTRWLEREMGGQVVSIEPQARWRPVWYAEVDRDAAHVPPGD